MGRGACVANCVRTAYACPCRVSPATELSGAVHSVADLCFTASASTAREGVPPVFIYAADPAASCWQSGALFQYPGAVLMTLAGVGAATFLEDPPPAARAAVAGDTALHLSATMHGSDGKQQCADPALH